MGALVGIRFEDEQKIPISRRFFTPNISKAHLSRSSCVLQNIWYMMSPRKGRIARIAGD